MRKLLIKGEKFNVTSNTEFFHRPKKSIDKRATPKSNIRTPTELQTYAFPFSQSKCSCYDLQCFSIDIPSSIGPQRMR